jgi:predicted DNA-binding transcriptional regulator AlpA
MGDSDRLMVDIDGVARLLDMSKSHVYSLRTQGKLPEGIKLGKARRWSVVELQRWIAAGCPSK